MEEKVPGVQDDPLLHFLSAADRDRKPVTDKIGQDADRWLGDFDDRAWRRLTIGDRTKGKPVLDILHQQVWLWSRNQSFLPSWKSVIERSKSLQSQYMRNKRGTTT